MHKHNVRYYNIHLKQEDDPDKYRRHEAFLERVKRIPNFHVFCARTVVRPWGRTEKGADVKLTVDMLHQAHLGNYDTAVLVSGDGDFEHAVQAIVDGGKHVENAYFWKGRSSALQNWCSRFIELNEAFLKPCLVPIVPIVRK